MTDNITNVSASVRARLSNFAKETQRPFQQVLIHYGIERFLYRLSVSDHREVFVLKGGLFFVLHEIPSRRFTRDIDLFGYTEYSQNDIEDVIAEICTIKVPGDGVVFDPASIKTQSIRAPVNQEGIRVKFLGQLGSARIHMQLDLGYRDEIYPHPRQTTYPTLLGMKNPIIFSYPPETIISEKFHAMIFLGEVNSRMKDFYDIWLLSKHSTFEGTILQKSIEKTFKNRETDLPASAPIAFQESFIKNSQTRWANFVSTLPESYSIPQDFSIIIEDIKAFLLPILELSGENNPNE